MATLYTQQDKNIRKTWFLMAMFLAFIIFVTWIFSLVYAVPEVLYVGVAVALGINLVSYWFADKVVLTMAGAQQIGIQDNPELFRLVENLSITAGLPMPKVYIMHDPAPNAFATGRKPENASVAVTTGLLERLERSELEGVLAHELSHIGNRDILLSTIIVILIGSLSLISEFFLRTAFRGGGGGRKKSNGLVIIIALVLAIFAPIIGSMIHLAISRKREFLADASGALLTRYPDGLASALEKISGYPNSVAEAEHATAHLYFASPFKGKQETSFLTRLFMAHPPIEERINALRGLDIK